MRDHIFIQHRFSFGECCVAIEERAPAALPETMPANVSENMIDEPSHSAPTRRVLFFLHGRFGRGDQWRKVIEPLQERYRCLVPDLPGFGQSFSSRERGLSLLENAHMIRNLITHFAGRDEKIILIGHDIGGALALMAAASPPPGMEGRITGLVLLNCTGLCEPSRGLRAGWLGLAARLLFSRCRAAGKRLDAKDREGLLDPWRHPVSRTALIRAFRALEDSWPGPFERQFWRREITRLRMPALILWGKRDRVNRRETGIEMVRTIPDALFFEEETCGHWPLLENPIWVATKVQEFLFHIGEREEVGVGDRLHHAKNA
jgi:abhydrolase domain-containing protein 6